LATITVETDDGRVIHKERVSLAAEQESRVAPLLAAVSERLERTREQRSLPRIMPVQSAVGRTFD
jgi:hypothetical protein